MENFLPGERELEKRADKFIEKWGVKHETHERERDNNWVETYRTRFRRDRDRILYSKGFRRLQNKTQVLVSNTGDHHRTRLTHTLEVQQIATSLADSLQVNRDLTDAIAVGHDLGHTPFGHAVEKMLNNKLKNLGGFSHSVQSVRIIEYLDKHDSEEYGLNLDSRVREGILKHDTDILEIDFDKDKSQWKGCRNLMPIIPSTVEAQIVYWADTIAYLSHDWDDFIESDLLDKAIKNEIINYEKLKEIWHPLVGEYMSEKIKKENVGDFVGFALRHLIRSACTNLVKYSSESLSKYNSPQKVAEATQENYKQNLKQNDGDKKEAYKDSLIVNFDQEYRNNLLKARKFLNKYFIGNNVVARMDEKAKYMVGKIYDTYAEDEGKNIRLLPIKTQNTIKNSNEPFQRIIADHIACMTDRYANQIYGQLFLPWRG